jgi:calcium/proton exchanger cax
LIISIQALSKGEITIVKTSLIGSMLSNMLLVMGTSFFLGGISREEQFFNSTAAQTSASLLALCVGSLMIPTAFHAALSGKFVSSEIGIIFLPLQLRRTCKESTTKNYHALWQSYYS